MLHVQRSTVKVTGENQGYATVLNYKHIERKKSQHKPERYPVETNASEFLLKNYCLKSLT